MNYNLNELKISSNLHGKIPERTTLHAKTLKSVY